MTGSVEKEWIVLLGRRDEPTDGVRDYCHYLADALERQGIRVTTVEMPWSERGWKGSLVRLWQAAGKWKGRRVLFQYTALAWSRRGFPLGAVAVMAVLRWRGVRAAVVFHDWTGYTGPRWRDRVRWNCQRGAMRSIARLAVRSTLPVPPKNVDWLRGASARALFIPIGANLPELPVEGSPNGHGSPADSARRLRTVGVFGVTEAEPGVREAEKIAAAVRKAASRLGGLRLVVFGRGSEQSRPVFERVLDGADVELSVLGLVSAEQVARELSRADAALFVRGEILGHRGSAIAGIACGTPMIGYGVPQRAFPLSEAGVVLVPPGDGDALAEELARVLSDDALRRSLCEKNRRAQAEYFSWQRIARQFIEALAGD